MNELLDFMFFLTPASELAESGNYPFVGSLFFMFAIIHSIAWIVVVAVLPFKLLNLMFRSESEKEDD